MPDKAPFAAALVLWLCALQVNGQPFVEGLNTGTQYSTEEQNGGRPAQNDTEITGPLLSIPVPVSHPDRSPRNKRAAGDPDPDKSDTPQDLPQRDILAQEAMAYYARLAVIVSGIAAVLLLITVYQTKKLMRQDRAWITFDYHGEVSADQINFHRAIALEFFNSGKTPALEVVSRISVTEVTDDMAGVADEDVSADRIQWSFQEEVRTNGVIGVGGRSRAAHTIKPAHMSGAAADGRGFFVLIKVDYKTIYETLGTRSYVGLFKVCEIRRDALADCGTAYSVRPVGKHTCT